MKKLALALLLFIGLSPFAFAQKRVSLPFSSYYDENAWLSLGLQYNYINSSYRLGLNKDWATMGAMQKDPKHIFYVDNFNSIKTVTSHGMSVGLPIELRLGDNVSTTFQPTFTFINSVAIAYSGLDNAGDPKTLDIRMRHSASSVGGTNFNAFEFPLNIRFRSDEKILKNHHNRYRGYIVGGARYTRWTGINEEYTNLMGLPTPTQPLIMKPGYFSWEAGFGAEIFFPFFRMSPEIKFIQSVGDVFDRGHNLAVNNDFMKPLEKTLIRNIQFSLIFQ